MEPQYRPNQVGSPLLTYVLRMLLGYPSELRPLVRLSVMCQVRWQQQAPAAEPARQNCCPGWYHCDRLPCQKSCANVIFECVLRPSLKPHLAMFGHGRCWLSITIPLFSSPCGPNPALFVCGSMRMAICS